VGAAREGVAVSTPELRLSDGAGGVVALRLESAPLGSGGDGSVYASTSHPELVAKLYHDPGRVPERRRKLLAMLQTPPRLDPIHHGGHPYVQLTWPTHLVEDAGGRFRGYAMPRVELDRAVLAETLLSRKTRKALRLPEAYGLRVTAASNLAAVVEALHARGHHVVDLKPVNAYVYRDTFFVALLDCDGFSVRGTSGERYPAHQYTPDYIAPEALAGELAPEALGEAQDRFALAVVVFQLLNGGVHPFQGVPAPGCPCRPARRSGWRGGCTPTGAAPTRSCARRRGASTNRSTMPRATFSTAHSARNRPRGRTRGSGGGTWRASRTRPRARCGAARWTRPTPCSRTAPARSACSARWMRGGAPPCRRRGLPRPRRPRRASGPRRRRPRSLPPTPRPGRGRRGRGAGGESAPPSSGPSGGW
jgi:hypothetical protein